MTQPDDALERARAAAQPAPPAGEVAQSFDRDLAGDSPSDEVLQEWAVISVDPEVLYSSRRLGGPVTFMKRTLLRLMRQYTAEIEAQQTRFNLAVLGRLRELERRRGE
jgi:predicted NBD/HSP70 family sugar kinase